MSVSSVDSDQNGKDSSDLNSGSSSYHHHHHQHHHHHHRQQQQRRKISMTPSLNDLKTSGGLTDPIQTNSSQPPPPPPPSTLPLLTTNTTPPPPSHQSGTGSSSTSSVSSSATPVVPPAPPPLFGTGSANSGNFSRQRKNIPSPLLPPTPTVQQSVVNPLTSVAAATPMSISSQSSSHHSGGVSGGLVNNNTSNANNNNNNININHFPINPDLIRGDGKRESYKDRKKHYQKQKKRVAEELLSTLNDPTVVVLTDWLKVRGTLKGWTKLWCELKPGLLVLYKSPKTRKSGQWVGTVLLNIVEVIERPSKKDGFCFKLFNPLDQSIWASRGPKGESFGAIMQPLPVAYLIFRAPSEQAGKTWMDAIELSLRCSTFLVKNNAVQKEESSHPVLTHNLSNDDGSPPPSASFIMNESEIEQHFQDHDLGDDDAHTDHEEIQSYHEKHSTDTESDCTEMMDASTGHQLDLPAGATSGQLSELKDEVVHETKYVPASTPEEFGDVGDEGQTEEVGDENKSLLWTLLKQVRPGMDLSKVVLPTFILEPRSFLEKITDYYFHCDILSKAVLEDDPLDRMKMVVKWYLSGFYKKPKGLKKPYNPILGETFRCYWNHPETESRTFYIAEQVSHHPPISAFYVTNRKDGFCISGSILAKSKFYGNSVSAILDGTARLTLLTRGEDYTITMPYAHCKGILMGTLTLELGGKVEIKCEKTGYFTELEFKLKPFLGGSELCNLVVGKIKLGKETLATLDGHWDTSIKIKNKKSGQESSLWVANAETRAQRLNRYTVAYEEQTEFESEKLWHKVSEAIHKGDQYSATEEKTVLEEAQRKAVKERQARNEVWLARHFVQDPYNGEWHYQHADTRPWDPRTDVLQYERSFIIQTKTRHKTPTVGCRTNSVISIESPHVVGSFVGPASGLQTSKEELLRRVGSVDNRSHFASSSSHHRSSRMSKSIESQASAESSSPEAKSGLRRKKVVTNTLSSKSNTSEEDQTALVYGSKSGLGSSLIGHSATTATTANTNAGVMVTTQKILDPIKRLEVQTCTAIESLNRSIGTVIVNQGKMEQLLLERFPKDKSINVNSDSNSNSNTSSGCIRVKDILIVALVAIIMQLVVSLALSKLQQRH